MFEQVTESSLQWRSGSLKHCFNLYEIVTFISLENLGNSRLLKQRFTSCNLLLVILAIVVLKDRSMRSVLPCYVCKLSGVFHVTTTISLPSEPGAVRACKLVELLQSPMTASLLQCQYQLCLLQWYLRRHPENHWVPEEVLLQLPVMAMIPQTLRIHRCPPVVR